MNADGALNFAAKKSQQPKESEMNQYIPTIIDPICPIIDDGGTEIISGDAIGIAAEGSRLI